MRLIDADIFKNYITYGYLKDADKKRFSINDVIEMIDKQPTAYDVDEKVNILYKVCTYLESKNKNKYHKNDMRLYFSIESVMYLLDCVIKCLKE